jgi:diaminopimelate decarboxylase
MQVNGRGHLEIGGCDVVELAKEFGTPLQIMDEKYIRDTCKKFYCSFTERGNSQVIYASKSFISIAMCRLIEEEGLGLDIVSAGELYTALQADFPMEKVYFHGNNKSPFELKMALEHGVGRIVVDNFRELKLLSEIAGSMDKEADILLRITPGVEAHTHEYIKTGQIDSKFGFTLPNGQAMEAVKEALKTENVNLVGLHCHIGSQIFEMESYGHAASVMMEFLAQIKKEQGVVIEELNLGGGFGIYYNEEDEPADIEEYAATVMTTVTKLAREYSLPVPKVIVEPGRAISGPAGTTIYEVGTIKDIPEARKYLAVDGGMYENIRPALYEAKYEVLLANKANREPEETVTITGKCCESGDMLAWDVRLPKAESGDILAISCTGAYGYSMASNYNRFLKPAVVLVKDGEADLIIKRESLEDLVKNEVLPERLCSSKIVSMASYR